jgi:Helix-turn-helix domain
MSIAAMDWAWKQSGLTPTEKFVLTCLADYHNSVDGGCYPSLSKIAERCCMGESTVRTAINGLIQKNLVDRVERTDRNGRQRSNQYNLNLDIINPPDNERGDPPESGPLEPRLINLEQDSDTTYRGDPLDVFLQSTPPSGKEFWDEAVGMMMALGVAEVTSRAFIGKCLKTALNDRGKVLSAITAAVNIGTQDPIPYISAVLSGKKPKRDAAWEEAVAELEAQSARREAEWRKKYGTEYGIYPNAGEGGSGDHGVLRETSLHEPSAVSENGDSGFGKVSARRASEAVRPSVGSNHSGEIPAIHSGNGDGSGEDF